MNREHLEALAALLRQSKGHITVKQEIVQLIVDHEKAEDPTFNEHWFRVAADVPAPVVYVPDDRYASYY